MKQDGLSKLQTAAVFGVDRLTIYSWVMRGCPCLPPIGPGKPSRMRFPWVLKWRLKDLEKARWSSPEYISKYERQVRERFSVMRKGISNA